MYNIIYPAVNEQNNVNYIYINNLVFYLYNLLFISLLLISLLVLLTFTFFDDFTVKKKSKYIVIIYFNIFMRQ